MTSLSPRTRLALAVERLASSASRATGRGSGEVIGGRLALRVAPHALAELGVNRPIACVSGTNGKTTTTRLLRAAVATTGEVKSNAGGANMSPGVLAALARPPYDCPAVLEVDEIYLPRVAREVRPRVVALLNISRDQLDRSNETRRIAALWRALGAELPGCVAVANADDPLVTWAASGYSRTVWVAAGQNWTSDALVCPACAALLQRDAIEWHCAHCGLRRPTPEIDLVDDGQPAREHAGEIAVGGSRFAVHLRLPGRVNVANAAIAVGAAREFGVAPDAALAAMSEVTAVQGRYATVRIGDTDVRLLLAKNPAGWVEMLHLLEESPARPLVIAFNSRVADGRDPSWIWDVPFERLRGRPVHVFGERADDMAVRLAYAEVPHEVHADVDEAVAAIDAPAVDLVANYTAFRDLLAAVPAASTPPAVRQPAPPAGVAR